MRIIAGEFGGRRLAVPGDARVRPTADRVREAWMSVVSADLVGGRVLDLFAGSGALGLEALSRGAAHATFVDVSRPSLEALRANIRTLNVAERTTVRRGDALQLAERLEPLAFDVAFADPPYATDQAERLVALFGRLPFARILGVEHRADLTVAGGDTRRYGSVALTFMHAP